MFHESSRCANASGFRRNREVQEAGLLVELLQRSVGAVDAIEPRWQRGDLGHMEE